MSPLEKKEHPWKFPRAPFDQTVYEAMMEWFPKILQAVDAGGLPLDSGMTAPSTGIFQNFFTIFFSYIFDHCASIYS